jgi:D-alanyl-D-alanine carboxypeptidase
MKNLIKITALLFVSVLFTNCNDDELPLLSTGPQFNMDLFEQNINDYVTAGAQDPIAWGYVISQNGTMERGGAFGDARNEEDGQVDFTINKEINVASVSKFYTAVGAMQLLEANGLTINDSIMDWLPASWVKGPGVSGLTFRDLLTHRSGLQSTNSNFSVTLGYQGLEDCIATGVVNPKTRNYLNVNFALFRVLIPALWDALPGSPAIDIESDANTQFMYLLYMQQNIFDLLDLPLVGCMPESRSTCTLYYNSADGDDVAGAYYGDWNPMCGGGGYFMTLLEMAKTQAYFEHTEVLLSEESKEIMKANRIGMDQASASEEHGSYYGKGGSIGNGANQGVQTQIEMFPINGVDIVVVMNTQGVTFQNGVGIKQMIYDAYNNAWE